MADGPRSRSNKAGRDTSRPQLALGRRIAGADLDQQLRQALGAQRFKVLRVEGGLGSHRIASFFSSNLSAVRRLRNLRSDSLGSSISRTSAPERLARKREAFPFY